MKQLRSTGILVVLVAIVAGYAYFGEYQGKIHKEAVKLESKKIIPFSLEDTYKFSVKTPTQDFTFKKEGSQWFMENPVRDNASFAAVQGYLSQFGQEVFEDVVAEGPDLNFSIYGLNNKDPSDKINQVSFTVRGKTTDETISIEVGSVTALEGKSYIRLNGQNRVLLAGFFWGQQFQKDMRDLRERNFVPPDFKVTKIEVDNNIGNKEKMTFEQKDGKWILDELKTMDPDQVAIDDIYYQVKNLKSLQVFREEKKPQDLARMGLNDPELKIHVYGQEKDSKDAKVIDLVFSKDLMGQSYGTSSDRKGIFSLNPLILKPFTKEVSDFRDKKKPLGFDLADVSQVEYRSDLSSFKLKKENNEWVATEKIEGKHVDNAKVVDILSKLSMMKVKKYFDQEISYQKSGTTELKLKNSKDEELLDLKWSPKPVDDVFVGHSNLSEKTFGLSMQDISSLPLHAVIADIPTPTKVEKVEGGLHLPATTKEKK